MWQPVAWPAPARVKALVTDRQGGASRGAYAEFNLALHVGDDPAAVAANRVALLRGCQGLRAIQWLQQVHGAQWVVAAAQPQVPEADASITDQPGLACAVLTADCLPVLLCDGQGRQVAAAHGGWRGLAAGILAQTVAAFDAPPAELMAWLGPAISQPHFEVGAEVRNAFLAQSPSAALAFSPSERSRHWYADLYRIARLQLNQLGVTAVYGGDDCSYTDSARFYSFRRDRTTGRMASLIYLAP